MHSLEHTHLSVNLLGPLTASHGGQAIAAPGGRQRAVLALLALDPNHTITRDRLMAELWTGEPPASAAANLRTYLSGVRRWLDRIGPPGAYQLQHAGNGWTVRLGPGCRMETDVTAFERDFGLGRTAMKSGQHADAVVPLRRAVLACRGVPLLDVPQGPALASRASILRAQWLAVVEDYASALLGLNDHDAARSLLYEHLARHPYRERAWGQLMLASYRAGDPAAALDTFRAARAALVEGLGIEPGPQLRSLHRLMLHRDPALDGGAAARRRAGRHAPTPVRARAS
ncbi:BTAD domain-containing putative transcriptional regulator [Micromonospora sp. NPDC049559]|uniref:AfsR/SARP family transcriptional regulator n=1 Tax=Micromonospora sp. NPDC049559 TaxID=3155923 RepID=UPI00343BE7B5